MKENGKIEINLLDFVYSNNTYLDSKDSYFDFVAYNQQKAKEGPESKTNYEDIFPTSINLNEEGIHTNTPIATESSSFDYFNFEIEKVLATSKTKNNDNKLSCLKTLISKNNLDKLSLAKKIVEMDLTTALNQNSYVEKRFLDFDLGLNEDTYFITEFIIPFVKNQSKENGDAIILLLRNGVNPNCRTYRSEGWRSGYSCKENFPLHILIESKNYKIIEALLENKADVNKKEQDSVKSNDNQIESRDESQLPLNKTCRLLQTAKTVEEKEKIRRLIKLLLKYNGDVNGVDSISSKGKTTKTAPIHTCIISKDLESIFIIMSKKPELLSCELNNGKVSFQELIVRSCGSDTSTRKVIDYLVFEPFNYRNAMIFSKKLRTLALCIRFKRRNYKSELITLIVKNDFEM